MGQHKDSGILYRIEYYDAIGDVVATLLMSQIHYWYSPSKNGSSKLRIYRNGKWWIAKSVSEWCSECHLTTWQVRRGIKLLEEKGLVETDSFMMGKSPVTHLRFLAVEGKGPIFEVPDLTPFLVKSPSPLVAHNNPLVADNKEGALDNKGGAADSKSITETTHENKNKLQQGASAAEPQSLSTESGEDMAVKLSTKGKALDSSKAILAKLSGDKKPIDDYQVSPKGLQYLWMNTVPEFHSGVGCQKAWTQKQQGFINRLVSLWGEGDTRQILTYVIERWIKFTKYCEDNSGAFKTPLLPNIDFVYKYGAEAKNFWLNRVTAKDLDINDPPKPKKKLIILKAKAESAPVQLIATPSVSLVSESEDDDDHEMTIEEMKAWKASKNK